MESLYNIFVSLLVFGMKWGSFFSPKLKMGIRGREESISKVKASFLPDDKVIWMHAASLGEYEQGLPVLEKLKIQFPHHKVLITFFSPSGYENIIKKKTVADVICYLPFDRKAYVDAFVSSFKTEIFFTVKYDFWYHLLRQLKLHNTDVYVVSALFYKNQIFFKPYGKWFVKELQKNVDWIFHQTESSCFLAQKIGLINSSVAGDTRYDRVKQNLKRDYHLDYIESFKDGQNTIIFGSSWEAEERIAEIIKDKYDDIKLILAPHDLRRLKALKMRFPEALLYSNINKNTQLSVTKILIIDSIGILSKLYSYGDIAVIGGGFHKAGLHNILEAAVFGIPVFFGNHYQKNPEADLLIAAKGAKSFRDEFFAASYILEVIKNPDIIEKMGENAKNFIFSQPDAAQEILNKITSSTGK